MEYTIKHDCFAIRTKINNLTGIEENECDALDDLYCKKSAKCAFYQNKTDFEKRKELLSKTEVK